MAFEPFLWQEGVDSSILSLDPQLTEAEAIFQFKEPVVPLRRFSSPAPAEDISIMGEPFFISPMQSTA